MHQDRCVQLAREAAVKCGERHDYMPATDLLAETWHPHRWVVDAMLKAAHEAETERDILRAERQRLHELQEAHRLLMKEAHTWSKAAETYAASEAKLADVLTELVSLEDMRLRLRELHEMGHGTDYYDYHRRLPLAWDAARKVLGPNV